MEKPRLRKGEITCYLNPGDGIKTVLNAAKYPIDRLSYTTERARLYGQQMVRMDLTLEPLGPTDEDFKIRDAAVRALHGSLRSMNIYSEMEPNVGLFDVAAYGIRLATYQTRKLLGVRE